MYFNRIQWQLQFSYEKQHRGCSPSLLNYAKAVVKVYATTTRLQTPSGCSLLFGSRPLIREDRLVIVNILYILFIE